MKSNALKMFCVWAVFSVFIATSAHAGGSIQAMGSWWDPDESASSYGFGLRGSIGSSFALDLGWTYYAGEDISIDLPNGQEIVISDGIDAHVFDLGARYTFPIELYLGGGASYFVFDSDVGSTDGNWGLYGLVGWSFGGEHIRGFIEGVYRYTEASIEFDGVGRDSEHDLSYDGFGANIGIMYRF
jgi:hypothetical protein